MNLLPGQVARGRRVSIRVRLLISFFGVGGLCAALFLFALDASQQLGRLYHDVLERQVDALSAVGRLHTELHALRTHEQSVGGLVADGVPDTELTVLVEHIERTERAFRAFAASDLELTGNREIFERAARAWADYQDSLEGLLASLRAGDILRAGAITQLETVHDFALIIDNLDRMTAAVNRAAGESVERTLRRTEDRHRLLLALTAAGLMLGAAYLWYLGTTVARRISRVSTAAEALAQDTGREPIRVGGNDELRDLADAFNQMQERVAIRETALREAQTRLEQRFAQSTRELIRSTQTLAAESRDKQLAEANLRLLYRAIDQSPVATLLVDAGGLIGYSNETWRRQFGEDDDDAGMAIPTLAKDDPLCVYRHLTNVLDGGEDRVEELEVRRADGEVTWVAVRVATVHDDDGGLRHHLVVAEDISLRKQQEHRIRRQAEYDALTDLPNRMLATDRLQRALSRAHRDERHVALLFIDLDGFKKINDALGHDTGDALLVAAARRLVSVVREADTVARQGGDEFLVIADNLSGPAEAETLVRDILAAFAGPFELNGHQLVVTPSIGVAMFPNDADAADMLLRRADWAMYQAKDAGRNTYHFYNATVHQHSRRSMEIESELRGALERQELAVHYQPLVDTASGAITGVEALLRWNSARLGSVSPGEFIPVAEQTGLIERIGEWVLTRACEQTARWNREHGLALGVSVNVSPRQFRDRRVVRSVEHALSVSGLDPECLLLEVTEGLLVRRHPDLMEMLDTLRATGARLVMDDFGTGYSSLSYLRRFPFDGMKIDRSFVVDLEHDAEDRALVNASIQMAHSLGLYVVAEGVETRAQQAVLREMQCDVCQGYLFDKPLRPEELEARWLVTAVERVAGATA